MRTVGVTINHRHQELHGGWLISQSVVDEPTQHRLEHRNLAGLSVFGDGDPLSKDLAENSADVSTTLRTPFRVSALTWSPSRLKRGATFADPIWLRPRFARFLAHHACLFAGRRIGARKSAWLSSRAASNSSKACPVDSKIASRRVNCCQRRTATSTYCGSISIQKARRPICSAAMMVEPEPAKVSRMIDPRFEQSLMASAMRATGLTVGCIFSSSIRPARNEFAPA